MSPSTPSTASAPHEVPFAGVRLRHASSKPFDELVEALLTRVGREPLPLDTLATKFDDWDSYVQAVGEQLGSRDLTFFTAWDHGGWIQKAGIQRRVLRVVIGNPLIAITMLRHDVTAGLFAPVELLLTDEADGTSALTYVRPSSLMVVEPNPPLREAALALDAKLADLAAAVTG